MDKQQYFRSITEELTSLKNRVRNFVEHWPTDGEWKESILRSVLRRHLPKSIGVGKGFIVTPSAHSSQIDVLFYDTSKPVLYQEGDLLILTPDASLGAIEVKTELRGSDLGGSIDKLADVVELASTGSFVGSRFYGLFVYQGSVTDPSQPLNELHRAVCSAQRRTINCLAIGESYFVRFWEGEPSNWQIPANRWHAYRLEQMAPAYFIHNVIEHLCPQSVSSFNDLWFPEDGKEPHKIAEMSR